MRKQLKQEILVDIAEVLANVMDTRAEARVYYNDIELLIDTGANEAEVYSHLGDITAAKNKEEQK